MDFPQCPTCHVYGIGEDSFIDTTYVRAQFLQCCPCIIKDMTDPMLILETLDFYHGDTQPITTDEVWYLDVVNDVAAKKVEQLFLLARPPPVNSRYRHIDPDALMSVRRNLLSDFEDVEMDVTLSDFEDSKMDNTKVLSDIEEDSMTCNVGDSPKPSTVLNDTCEADESMIEIPLVSDENMTDLPSSFFDEVPEWNKLQQTHVRQPTPSICSSCAELYFC